MDLKIPALKKKLLSKDRSFWISVGLHLFLILVLIVSIPKNPKLLQISGSAKVQIVNATFINTVPAPTPPVSQPAPQPTPQAKPAQPAAQPKPAVQQVKPKPKPVPAPKPAPKPQPQPKPAAKAAAPKTPTIEAKQADIKKPVQNLKTKSEQAQLQKQAKALEQKAAELKKQQAAEALKAMALSSIQTAVQTQQQQAAAAAAQQRLISLKEQYMALIQQTIRANWINQFNPSQNLTATLQINLDPSGNVLSVSLVQSSGNPTFDRQAILAVRKSSPLPLPQDPTLLKDFLSITLPFSNQGDS
ncbi:MAG: hypothetical protein K0Q57_849 [Gammaproteobacteria bacterium]|jgi:colicin import membrane protein|nr:hypothetical protein [Gammaproteobacteria bacterium]